MDILDLQHYAKHIAARCHGQALHCARLPLHTIAAYGQCREVAICYCRRWTGLSRPPFPLIAALLPACRQRVKLAVRLDVILREQSKVHAGRNSHLQTTYQGSYVASLPSFASSGAGAGTGAVKWVSKWHATGTRHDSLASVPVAAVKSKYMYVLAEKSWKQRTAEAMDMEVSSDDEDEDAPAAKKSRQPQQSNDGSSLAYMQRVSRQP